MLDARRHRLRRFGQPLIFEKSCDLAHGFASSGTTQSTPAFRVFAEEAYRGQWLNYALISCLAAAVRASRAAISASARLYSDGNTLTNLLRHASQLSKMRRATDDAV